MIDCEKCVHYELCLDFVCSKQDMERDTDCDYYEPDRQHGEWERDVYGKRYCSACGQRAIYHATTVRPLPHLTNFCPNCGASMRKEGEAE